MEKLFSSFGTFNNGMNFLVHDHVIIQSIHSNHRFVWLTRYASALVYVCMCGPKAHDKVHVTLIEFHNTMSTCIQHKMVHDMHGFAQNKSRFPTASSTRYENSSKLIIYLDNHKQCSPTEPSLRYILHGAALPLRRILHPITSLRYPVHIY